MGTTDNRSRSGGDGNIRNASRQACLAGTIGLVAALSAPCAMSASGGDVHGAMVHSMQGMESEHMMSALPGSKSSFALSAVYPRSLRGAYKLRLFIEGLTASFSVGEPPWDRALIDRGLISAELIDT